MRTKRNWGSNAPRWQGGTRRLEGGYVIVFIGRDDPYYSMKGKQSAILEHRLIMARHLKRCLKPNELVHHVNGIKDDNRIENLRLVTTSDHARIHWTKPKQLIFEAL